MTNTSLGSPLQRYAAVNDFMLGKNASMSVSFSAMMRAMKETKWTDPYVEGGGKSCDGHVRWYATTHCFREGSWLVMSLACLTRFSLRTVIVLLCNFWRMQSMAVVRTVEAVVRTVEGLWR